MALNSFPLPNNPVNGQTSEDQPYALIMTPAKDFGNSEKVLLQEGVRLSESLLWSIQTDYYARRGMDAWNKTVPFFVTNSTYIAETYADLVIAYLKDYAPHLKKDEPVYIIELATGTGRFSYYLLKELLRKQAAFTELRNLKLRYIMTDFTEQNIALWKDHEKLKPYLVSGHLDFSVFSPEESTTLKLWNTQLTLTSETIKNPVIAIANYFFDSVRQDAFRVCDEKLEESRVTLTRCLKDAQPNDPIHIGEIESSYTYHPVEDSYYPNPRLNTILQEYRKSPEINSILFPLGAFNCIANLETLSNNQLVLLSSDKGFTCMDYAGPAEEHNYAVHDGAFSYMVNYHAIGRYFQQAEGKSLLTTDQSLTLQTALCLNKPPVECTFENLEYLFQEKLNRSNPINFVWEVQSLVAEVTDSTAGRKLGSLLSYLRISLCEPVAFCQITPFILNGYDNLTELQEADLRQLMEKTWDNYYFFPGECKLPFWMAQMYFWMDDFEKSLFFFNKTLMLFGPIPMVHYFIGKCHELLENKQAACEAYATALTLQPNFPEAAEALQKMTAKV